ncbi:hypothetical protein Aperf_G00000022386 [Anoplocephala perfoliata]
MASPIRRSSRSLAYSLNHSYGEPSRIYTGSVMLADWDTKPKGVSMSTIPPVDSKSWKKLPNFQRRFYEWLVYSHNLPIANEEENQEGSRRQQPAPSSFSQPPEVYSGYRLGDEVDSGINAYDEEEEDIRSQKRSFVGPPFSEAVEKDAYSPYVGGMDVRLAQFVSHHNVNMDDGAIIYPLTPADKTDGKKRKTFTPPCGCTRRQFIWAVIVITVAIIVLLSIAITLGLIFGRTQPFGFPEAKPWWTHGIVYQIHVPTFANDVGGALGRLKDVTSRMVYVANKLHATAAILTGVLDSDKNGVRNWMSINQDINSEGDTMDTLLADLKTKSRGNGIELMLGMPLYATSERHTWFQQSILQDPPKFANFYIWRKEAPINRIEARYFAYNSVRNAYYRHVHGNPGSPLLNLTDSEVQKELKAVITFWKEQLGISGVFVTNSTNILDDMSTGLTTILSSGLDENTNAFTWFADNPTADKLLTGKQLCFYELISNERITSRTGDISAQLNTILPEIKQRACSPIWGLEQKSLDYTDYFSLQKFAAFLPGLSVMKAGEEVQLMTGATELIQWDNRDPDDFKTYWPINVLPDETAQGRLAEWERYGGKTVGARRTIFKTGWETNEVKVVTVPRTENLFVVQRVYTSKKEYTATFFVSFQALNAYTNLAEVIPSSDGGSYADLVRKCSGLNDHFEAVLDMQPMVHYSGYSAPGVSYDNSSSRLPGDPNNPPTVPAPNQIPSHIPYNPANFLFNAMAAAAAVGNPLCLPNMIAQGSPSMAYNTAYQTAAYNQYYQNYQQQYTNANFQRQNSAFQPTFNYGLQQYPPGLANTVKTANTPRNTKGTTSTTGRKTKKRPPSEPPDKADLRKRDDFDRLARARTDRLLTDKSLLTPLAVSEIAANASSTSSCNSMHSGDQTSASHALAMRRQNILHALLDEQVRVLMLCPSLQASLRKRQAAIYERMRNTETFVAKMRSNPRH